MSASASTILLGGVPAHHDLAPSILFCVLYGLLLPIWIYRIVDKPSRSTLMIRPGIFVQIRIVTLAIRAYMSQGHYAEGLFIAEIIFLTVGLIALLEPLIACFKSQIHPWVPPKKTKGAPAVEPDQPKHWLTHVATFLRIALLAIIVTGVYAGSISGSAFNDPNGSNASTLKTLKLVNSIVAIAVLAVLILATVAAQLTYDFLLERTKSGFLIVACAMLLIPSVFKLATSHREYHWVHSTSAFYILLILWEFLVTAMLLVFPCTQWFPSEKARKRHAEEEAGLEMDMERGSRAGSGEAMIQQDRH